MIKLEPEVSTFEITCLGNFEKIPESVFIIFGTLILNVEEVETPDNTAPLLMPATVFVDDNVSVLPLELIFDILLKCGSFAIPLLNAIIVSVLIPTPAKLRLLT